MKRFLVVGSLIAFAVVAWAGKGGGGGKPPTDAEFTVAYKDNSIAGRAWLMTANGDARQSLTGFDIWSVTNWTPDGKALLVTSEVDGRGIYTIDVSTKARTKLLPVTDWGNSPDWSSTATPNGRQTMVFVDDVDVPTDTEAVFVADTDGTGVIQLTATEAGRHWDHPRFHPDGDRIAVTTWGIPASELKGVIVLHLGIDAAGALEVTGTTNLTNLAGSPLQGVGNSATGFQFSNSGALGVLSDGTDIWLLDLSDPAYPVNLTQGAGGAQPLSPCFDAADEKIYFVSFVTNKQGGGSWRMFRMNVDGTGIEQITNQKAGTTSGVSCKRA